MPSWNGNANTAFATSAARRMPAAAMPARRERGRRESIAVNYSVRMTNPNSFAPQDRPALRLALTTFSILVLELALIRWLGTQVRFAAYFANLVLLSAFLGMGLGVGLAR